jgi:hypothetical protein
MQDPYEEPAGFEDFWTLWVRRVAKKDALKEWNKLSPEKQVLAIIGAAEWRPVWVARGEMQYVPHASTWLHGERWDDEIPSEFRKMQTYAPVTQRENQPKSVMPDYVRAMIASLRTK